MIKIVITYPQNFHGELEQIVQVMQDEHVRLHLRKPEANEFEYERFLQSIPEEFHSRVVIHNYYHLQHKYIVGGLHFSTEKRPQALRMITKLPMSTSCHSVREVQAVDGAFEYVFLSPIFPSISKQGYVGHLNPNEVKNFLRGHRSTKVIALGGVEESQMERIHRWGFDGYAQLGSIWKLNSIK